MKLDRLRTGPIAWFASSVLATAAVLVGAAWWPHASRPGAPPAETRERAPLAERVLAPTVARPQFAIDPAKRGEILRRLRPRPEWSASHLLHALHLYGPGATVTENGTGLSAPVLDLLLDADRGEKHFRSPKVLQPTRNGARFAAHEVYYLGTNQNAAEAHPGQALAVLAQLGLPTDRPVRLPDGRAGTLQLVVDDLVANFSLDGEIFWDVLPVMLYLPPARSWRTKLGREYTFDDVARELLRRPADRTPCAGTHRLLPLAVLLRVDAETPVLSDAVRTEVRGHLRLVARVLTDTQRPQGFWETNWTQNLPGSKRAKDPLGGLPIGRVIATGHHVEWLMLLPDDLRPPDEVFARAGTFLVEAVLAESKDALAVGMNYCPLVHAARSAVVLSDGPGPDRRK